MSLKKNLRALAISLSRLDVGELLASVGCGKEAGLCTVELTVFKLPGDGRGHPFGLPGVEGRTRDSFFWTRGTGDIGDTTGPSGMSVCGSPTDDRRRSIGCGESGNVSPAMENLDPSVGRTTASFLLA